MFNKYDLDKIRGLADKIKEIRGTFTPEQLGKIKKESEENWVANYAQTLAFFPKKTSEEDAIFENIFGKNEEIKKEIEGVIIENNPIISNKLLYDLDFSKIESEKLNKYKHTQKAVIKIQKQKGKKNSKRFDFLFS